jgi:hypothetical protein
MNPRASRDGTPANDKSTSRTHELVRAYIEAETRTGRIEEEAQLAIDEATREWVRAREALTDHLRFDLKLPNDDDNTGILKGVVVGCWFVFYQILKHDKRPDHHTVGVHIVQEVVADE